MYIYKHIKQSKQKIFIIININYLSILLYKNSQLISSYYRNYKKYSYTFISISKHHF